jgi:hypothetical protein
MITLAIASLQEQNDLADRLRANDATSASPPSADKVARHSQYFNMARGTAGRAAAMNEDQFNLSLRKFLKEVGVTSQRVIENTVRDGVKSGRLVGNETLRAKMTLEVEGIAIRHVVEGEIVLG